MRKRRQASASRHSLAEGGAALRIRPGTQSFFRPLLAREGDSESVADRLPKVLRRVNAYLKSEGNKRVSHYDADGNLIDLGWQLRH